MWFHWCLRVRTGPTGAGCETGGGRAARPPRGPDEHWTFSDSSSTARFYRRSIVRRDVPLSSLRFPSNISYAFLNGVIHNFSSLVPDAETEYDALARVYYERGTALPRALVGGFACVVKPSDRELFLAVDMAGEKTLYWAEEDGILFYSTSSLLLALLLRKPTIDDRFDLLHLVLRGLPVGMSYFSGISSIPPGSFLLADASGLERASWMSRQHKTPLGPDENLRRYVAERLVPGRLGLALSGGLDSSALLAELLHSAGDHVVATLLDAQDPDTSSDLEAATAVARSFDVRLACVPYCTEHIAPGSLRDFPVLDQDEYGVSCLAAFFSGEGCDSLITGDGADELFCGYYRIFNWALSEPRQPQLVYDEFLQRVSYVDLGVLAEKCTKADYPSGFAINQRVDLSVERIMAPSPFRTVPEPVTGRGAYPAVSRSAIEWLIEGRGG